MGWYYEPDCVVTSGCLASLPFLHPDPPLFPSSHPSSILLISLILLIPCTPTSPPFILMLETIPCTSMYFPCTPTTCCPMFPDPLPQCILIPLILPPEVPQILPTSAPKEHDPLFMLFIIYL